MPIDANRDGRCASAGVTSGVIVPSRNGVTEMTLGAAAASRASPSASNGDTVVT